MFAIEIETDNYKTELFIEPNLTSTCLVSYTKKFPYRNLSGYVC